MRLDSSALSAPRRDSSSPPRSAEHPRITSASFAAATNTPSRLFLRYTARHPVYPILANFSRIFTIFRFARSTPCCLPKPSLKAPLLPPVPPVLLPLSLPLWHRHPSPFFPLFDTLLRSIYFNPYFRVCGSAFACPDPNFSLSSLGDFRCFSSCPTVPPSCSVTPVGTACIEQRGLTAENEEGERSTFLIRTRNNFNVSTFSKVFPSARGGFLLSSVNFYHSASG